MAWIKMVNEDEATGPLKEIYEGIRFNRTALELPEINKVFSVRPDLFQARHWFGQAMTFGGSGLGRYREELIAVSISTMLNCKF